MTTVAIVGTGRMGGAMAKALASRGFRPVLQNRTRERAARVAAAIDSARVVDTPADAAHAAEVVITMLANDDAVRSTYAGLAEAARPGNVFVDMSTVMPHTIRAIEPSIRPTGAGLLDAPVSGSVPVAEAGELTLMVGGDAADLERARPVLEAVGKTIFHVGPLGTGAAMKLAINAVIFGLDGALSEGLVIAERAGIDRTIAYDVIRAGAPGAPYVGYKRPAFLDPEGTPIAFSLELAEKDLRLITSLADELGVPVPQSRTNLDVMREAIADQGAGSDFSAIAVHLRDRAAAQSAGLTGIR